MQRILICLAATTLLVSTACGSDGGVDRAGTKARVLDALDGIGLTDEQNQCLADSIDRFTDDELQQLDDGSAATELRTRLTDAMTTCVTAGVTTVTDPTTLDTAPTDAWASTAPDDPCATLGDDTINAITDIGVSIGVPTEASNAEGGVDRSCIWTASDQLGYVSVTYNSAFTSPDGFSLAFADAAPADVDTLFGVGLVGSALFDGTARALVWTSQGALDLLYVSSNQGDPAADIGVATALAEALGT